MCGKDGNKGGWLDPELCVKARREEVEYIRRHKMNTRVSRETCLREAGRAPIRMGGDRQGATREAQRAREVGREGVQDTCKARAVCVNAAFGSAASCAF